MDEAGCFLEAVDKSLALLIGDQENVEVVTNKTCEMVKPLIERILQHCIAVAQASSQTENKNIINASENVNIF